MAGKTGGHKIKKIIITEEMRRQLETLPDARGWGSVKWTKEMDELLVKYWPIKTKSEISRILGLHETTLRKRYRQLIREREGGTV